MLDKRYISFHPVPILRTLHALVLRTCRWWSNAEKKGKREDEKEKDEKRMGGRGWSEQEVT
ncbi:hypothetical protein ALC57_09521 [Trachymyrmex cornetzi]|uniref:Uncharacterized protein n=1 Tax=Trachymyrmex cornetzi TaxID=471704 RepID=A0A195DZC6_9HYME|nr:hypothetical protein ALC57_09521 [Trachymyrmex cornetzi]